MKVGRRKPGVVYYRGRIYVVGGMGKDKDLNCVQVLNPVTEEWENDADKIPEKSTDDHLKLYISYIKRERERESLLVILS